MLRQDVPNPGSPAAIKNGCICDPVANDPLFSRQWHIQPDCRLHGMSAVKRYFIAPKPREVPDASAVD